MKVIGAGLLRTGTLSTLTALVANILKKAGYCRNRGHPPVFVDGAVEVAERSRTPTCFQSAALACTSQPHERDHVGAPAGASQAGAGLTSPRAIRVSVAHTPYYPAPLRWSLRATGLPLWPRSSLRQ